MLQENLTKGRGAQYNPENRFHSNHLAIVHEEGIDTFIDSSVDTQLLPEYPKKLVNKVESPDVGMLWSVNPYQGCEHGCVYCYARNTHEYWGYSAGLDFESKIIYKPNAAKLLEAAFKNPSWEPQAISLSGNTDCYQPAERKLKITRALLKVCLEYRNPVSIITKNNLVLRDIDILEELASMNLVSVMVSINGVNERIREKLEPRTVTYKSRLNVVERLAERGIPVGVLVAPIIPGLNDHEMPEVLRRASKAGANNAGYIVLRLNGKVAEIFKDWVYKAFPDRANKILNQVQEIHGGQVNDSRFGTRMKGEGTWSEKLNQLFKITRKKYFEDFTDIPLNTAAFIRNKQLFIEW